MEKRKVANGVFWLEIPESDLRILCGCPADAVKLLMGKGLIAWTKRGEVGFETGPNAILLSDTPIQRGSFANLSEFPILQMLYRQGMILPGHPNNTGRRPLLIGLADQVRAQSEYVFRGNYGLSSVEEIAACGVPLETAREMYRVKEWFAFGRIRPTEELIDLKIVDASVVQLAPGAFVHRKGFNHYEFFAGDESIEVDLTLGAGEEFEAPYAQGSSEITRERFSVIHIGEGDGWDIKRPCMGSIVCFEGLLYLVDAGPNITRSLAALGISMGEIEGIFHTHAHDDHFAGLTSLVASERRLKYFAVPYVRSTVQKKLSALMRFDEERFSRYFEIHDLVADRWNDVGGLEVRPLYSPHPVDTTVFFFRASDGDTVRTYAHLADLPSFAVLGRLAEGRDGIPALSEASRASFAEELLQPVDVKKIDVGGGLIHGSAGDFASDASAKIILSHGYTAPPGAPLGTATIASFGDVDTLFPGGSAEFYTRRARAHLASWFPDAPAAEIEALSRSPISEFRAGSIVQAAGALDEDLHLILSGVAELADTESVSRKRRTAGALLGGARAFLEEPSRESYRAESRMTVLSIPAGKYREFIDRSGLEEEVRQSIENLQFLSRCPVFAEVHSEGVLYRIARSMEKRPLRRGATARCTEEPGIQLLAGGEINLTCGERLIETLSPGDFWGEELVISTAPALCAAQAAGDSQYFFVPGALLADIPVVQWKLLETFERRIGVFRAGFRFQWLDFFSVGVEEMDEQHRKLFGLVDELSGLMERSGKISGHREQKEKLLAHTRFHFQSEEELMKAHGYPWLAAQTREHEDMVGKLEGFLEAEEKRGKPRSESAVDFLKDWLIRHTLLEDLRYKAFFAENGVR